MSDMSDIRLRAEVEERIWRRYFRAILWPVLFRVVSITGVLVLAVGYFLTFPDHWLWAVAWVVVFPPLWWMVTQPEITRARRRRDDDLRAL